MDIRNLARVVACAAVLAQGLPAWSQLASSGEGGPPPARLVKPGTADPQSIVCGLYISGVWNFTLDPNFSGGPKATVFGPPAPNDLRINNDAFSCYSTTGTLRLEYWVAVNGNQPTFPGGPFIGTRIAIFPNNGQLAAGFSFVNINGSAGYTLPTYGTYWLVMTLAQFQPGVCGSADNFCYSDSYVSSSMITIGNNTLTVSKAGAGVGTVTGVNSAPAVTVINCGVTCSASVFGGNTVTLTATPQAGSVFAGWSGGGCTGVGSCTVPMSSAQAVTATFNVAAPVTFALNVTKSGNGTVTSNVGGINCGVTCSVNLNTGTAVSLTATPAIGYNFTGWTLDCAGTGTCNLTMNSNHNVTAIFTTLPVIPTTSRARTDFNNDKKSDILYRNATTGQVYRMLMNGFTVTPGAMAYTEPNLGWKIVQDADFNFDGSADLLWRNDTTGGVYMLPFNASGLPNPGTLIATEPNPAWKIVATMDIDGDNKADILWWNATTGQVYAMLMNGTAITAQGFVYTEPNTAWRIVATGDFSGSGKRNQLLYRNSTTGQLYLMTVSTAGGGVFTTTGTLFYTEPNLAWKVIGAPDLNADGKSDILWRNDATGQVYGMLMNGATISSQAMVYTEPNLAWKIVAQGDYNGDNRADILYRNDTTGQLYLMLMDGLAVAAQGMVYTEPNLAWKVLGPMEYAIP